MKFNSLAILVLVAPTASAFSPNFIKKFSAKQYGAALPIFRRQKNCLLQVAEDKDSQGTDKLTMKEQGLGRISEAMTVAETTRKALDEWLATIDLEKTKLQKKVTAARSKSGNPGLSAGSGLAAATATLFALAASNGPAPAAAEELLLSTKKSTTTVQYVRDEPAPAPKVEVKNSAPSPATEELLLPTKKSTTTVQYIRDEAAPALKVEVKRPWPVPVPTSLKKNAESLAPISFGLDLDNDMKVAIAGAAAVFAGIVGTSTISDDNDEDEDLTPSGTEFYLDNISVPGTVQPKQKTERTNVNGTGITSYLDNMSGAGMTSYRDILGPVVPDPVATTIAPPGPGITSYFEENFGGNQVPTAFEDAAIAAAPSGYLGALVGSTTALSEGGITSYLDTLPSSGCTPSGTGMTSYLDTMGGGASAAVRTSAVSSAFSSAGATAMALSVARITSHRDEISDADQVSEIVTALQEAAIVDSVGPFIPATSAAFAGDYLGALGGSTTSLSGGGLTSYLDTLPSSGSSSYGAGMTSYLDTMGEGASAAFPPSFVSSTPDAAAAPVSPSVPATSAASAGDYLGALGGSTTSLSGGGLTSYLDTLPSSGSSSYGAGMTSYINTMGGGASAAFPLSFVSSAPAASESVVAPSGSKTISYLDGISGEDEIPELVSALEEAAAPFASNGQTSFLESMESQISRNIPDDTHTTRFIRK